MMAPPPLLPPPGGMPPPPNYQHHPGMMMPPPPTMHLNLPPGVPPPGAVPMSLLPMPPSMMMMMIPPPPSSSSVIDAAMNSAEGLDILGTRFDLHLNLHAQNFAQTVILTNLPPFLRGVRPLRDASYPCGMARTVHVGCCLPSNDVDKHKNNERGMTEAIMHALGWNAANGGLAVVKMGHYSSARDLAGGMIVLSKCAVEGRLPLEKEVQLNNNDATITTTTNDNLPTDYDDDQVIEATTTTTTTTTTTKTIEDENIKGEDDDAAKTGEEETTVDDCNNEDGNVPPTSLIVSDSSTKNEESMSTNESPIIASKYSEKDEADHFETLNQLKNMKVHHLFNYHIPEPIPPDLTVPQPDPVPDSSVPLRLLEALTTLRLRYNESVQEACNQLAKSGKDVLATTVSIYGDQWGGHTEAAGTELDGDSATSTTTATSVLLPTMKLDTAKLAAAAGGGDGYDEEADPLNAPEVISEVLKFKKRLEDQNSKGKVRRIEIVNERMARKVGELLERGRREREERKTRALLLLERQHQGHALQAQHKEEGEQLAAKSVEEAPQETGCRGVSNLPAWMTAGANNPIANGTKNGTTDDGPVAETSGDDGRDLNDGSTKRKFIPSEANRDINTRKQKLDVDGMSLSEIRAANMAADAAASVTMAVDATSKESILSTGIKFPPLPPSAADGLKAYITSRIVDYLGEEESTLIEFIMKELNKDGGCTTLSLLEEMNIVLDEDSEDFVLGLYRKMLD